MRRTPRIDGGDGSAGGPPPPPGVTAGRVRPAVTAVIVTYKRLDDARRCLRSIERQIYPNLETIVIDNDSAGDVAATLGREFPTARIYRARSNVGLVRAQNAAVRLARGEYLLFLNDDTELVDAGYVGAAVGLFERDPGLGAIGGEAVLDEAGRVAGVLYLRLRLNGVPKRQNLYELPAGELRETDVLTGVHIFTRKALIERIGGFDPFYFLHYDDADSTYRIARLGYRLAVMGRVPLAHWHSPVARRWDIRLQGRNRVYFALKNLPWWRVLLLPLGDLWLVASRAANVPRLVRRVRTIEDPGEPGGLASKKLAYTRLAQDRGGGATAALREAIDRTGYALVEWFMGLLILFGGYAFVLPHLGRAIRARRASPDFLAEADLDQFTPIATPEPVEVEAPP
ncbi:MAG TPA: glycosyltransferase family 2 protein, partial [Geminicoccaceae bacterium]|nr:glycosyltransferase family 2 protein [Geminicoccaceae bacterium]